MDLVNHLLFGFKVAVTPINFFYCFVGAVLGTVVGVLPGMNPVIVISMLLPLTFKIPATAALIMLAGIYYGCHHSGATCAIMLNMPGEPSSLVICLDGHPLARQGHAGRALCMAALSSFFAGCVCIVVIALFAPPISDAALQFQGPEYTAVVILALVGASSLSSRSVVGTLAMSAFGLLLGTIGTDFNSGIARYTFGDRRLADGLSFVAVAVGLFAITEIAFRLGDKNPRKPVVATLRSLVPQLDDIKACTMPAIRGTTVGGLLGMLPGTGPLIAAFASYMIERKLAKDPSRFGSGAIEGVAGPEAADNAAALTHFIPMLTLGIPAGATFALMLGALQIQGISTGPQVITEHPELFWGLIASMWIGNLMLLILNLPLVGVWIKLLQTPYRFLYPTILAFSCIGIFSVRNEPYDILIAVGAGVAGYVLRLWDCSPAPLILGLVLGPIMEENMRRSLTLSRGDPTIFLTRPISLAILSLAAFLLALIAYQQYRTRQTSVAKRMLDKADMD